MNRLGRYVRVFFNNEKHREKSYAGAVVLEHTTPYAGWRLLMRCNDGQLRDFRAHPDDPVRFWPTRIVNYTISEWIMDKKQYTNILETLGSVDPVAELGAMRAYDEITDPKALEYVAKLEELDELFDKIMARFIDYCREKTKES